MPDWKQIVRERLAELKLAPEREAEILEELAQDLEQRYSEALTRGALHAAAMQAALDELEGSERIAQAIRAAELADVPKPLQRAAAAQRESARGLAPGRNRGNMIGNLWQDLRYGARMLTKNPGFTAVAVLTLALGIGANTAIFSVLHAVVLQPLKLPDADRVMMLWEFDEGSKDTLGFPTFTDWRTRSRSLESAAAVAYWNPVLSGAGDPVVIEAASVSGEFFQVFRVGPLLGRTLTPEDDRPNNRIAVISHALWTNHLGGDPQIIGRPILLNGVERTVVGVMPRDFPSLLTYRNKPAEVWRPLAYSGEQAPACRTCRHLRAVVRLRPDVAREQAQSELNSISQQMKREHPTQYSETGAILEPLREHFSGEARPLLSVLFGAVGFVLLVACANVANLLLARSAGRRREWAVRIALGASRGRLAAQVLTENMLLALAGGLAGVALAVAGTRVLIANSPASLPGIQEAAFNFPTLLFALGASLLTGLLFGLAPALHAARLDPQAMLKEGSRGSGGRTRHRLRAMLVVSDVALALVLLAGAGLMLKSIARLLDVSPGFSTEHLLTLELSVFGPKYYGEGGDARVVATFEDIRQRVAALPGVQAAGTTALLPLSTNSDRNGVRAMDKPIANPADAPSAYRYGVTPGYLEAMQIPLRRGRLLGPQDTAQSQPVVVINQTFAERFWPGEDPIGKFVHMGAPERPWRMVVGVVGNVRHAGLDEPDEMQFYAPESQWPYAASDVNLMVRATGDPQALAAAVRQAVWAAEKDVRIGEVAPMREVVRGSFARRSFAAALLGLFAGTAVLLAAVGIYGVMSQAAAQRTPEIGIRMALGAQRGDVLRMILTQGMQLVLAGIAVGIAGALALTRSIQSLLFAVEPNDPLVLAAVAAALAGVALLASSLPAWRAARTDPIVALRYE